MTEQAREPVALPTEDDTLPLTADAVNEEAGELTPAPLSPIGQIINHIGDLLAGLPNEFDKVTQGIQERLVEAYSVFEGLAARESAARQQVADLKRDLRHQKEQVKLLRLKIFSNSSDTAGEGNEDDPFDLQDDGLPEEEPPHVTKGKRKQMLPKNIKTIEIDHFPEDGLCSCGCQRKPISHWTSRKLVVIPEHFVLEKHNYYTMACNRTAACKDNKPVTAHAGGFIMKKRKFDLDLVIEAVVQKFHEHSTHYRQERRYGNRGHNVARQTVGRNAAHVAGFLEPVCDEIWKHVTAGHSAHMDETPLRVQAEGKCDRGFLWAICRDERGWNDDARPAVYYRYDESRGSHVAEDMLKGAQLETIQTDGYSGYNSVRRKPGQNEGVNVARCMAHARRKFTDAEKAAPSKAGKSVIREINKLYKVEKKAYGLDQADRAALRVSEAMPILDKIRSNLMEVEPDLPKGALKNAAKYFLDAWEDLTRYVYDGRLEIDNNPVERCMRAIAVSKKNSLFAGNHVAAGNWAIYYTLIETARLNGVDPFAYLKWVAGEIEKGRDLTDYSLLMPWHYQAAVANIEVAAQDTAA